MPEPDLIYVACGSMGTTAGLVLGCKAAGLKSTVVAVKVGSMPSVENIVELCQATNFFVHTKDPLFKVAHVQADDFIFEEAFLGAGYAAPTQEGYEALEIMQRRAGINLDLTYSGKACAALIAHARQGALQDKVVLFWDTFCGDEYFDSLAEVDTALLPVGLQQYCGH